MSASSRMGKRARGIGALPLVAALVVAGCSETGPVGGGDEAGAAPDAGNQMAAGGYVPVSDEGPVVERFPDANWFNGEVPSTAEAADPDAEPVKVGFIGINDGPIAALPELLQANDHCRAVRIAPTKGLPHWEKLPETTAALDEFWAAS